MASTINWPTTLPQQFLVDGYKETHKDNVLRTSMDAAVNKQRRKYSAIGRDISGRMLLTSAEKEIFEDFYHETLRDGTLEFNMPIIGSNSTTRLVRFMGEPPEYDSTGIHWMVSLKLEQMP